jgi:REP element-mobilizing transposase RayT
MSELYQSLSHSKWDCKYHVVFVPKRRRKAGVGSAFNVQNSVRGHRRWARWGPWPLAPVPAVGERSP